VFYGYPMRTDPDLHAMEQFSCNKETFRFKEYRDAYHPHSDIRSLLRELLPQLSRLRLAWREEQGEIIVSRQPCSDPFKPGKEDLRSAEAWLSEGGLPFDLQQLIEEYITGKTGKPWNDAITLQRIRTSIMQQKSQYWREGNRKIGYRKGYAVFAYLAYQAPVTFFQFSHVFLQVINDGLIPGQVRILDVGTGPGTVPLAVAGLIGRLPGLSAEIFALERSEEFIEAYCQLVPKYAGKSGRITVHTPLKGDIRNIDPLLLPSAVDLIVFQNVLNELPGGPRDKARIITSYSRLLMPGGAMIIIEPADREKSIALREMVNAAVDKDLIVKDPCRFIRGGSCHAGLCWSFQERPSIKPTRLMKALSGEREAFRFQNTDIKFSHAVLAKDQKDQGKKYQLRYADNALFIPLSSLRRFLGRKVNIAAAVMSGDIGDSKTHVFLICDGTGLAYAILPGYHVTQENRALLTAAYASVLEFRKILVRYNKNQDAWNLLLSKNSSVRPNIEIECR
jgi:SAM-dependent methyltransferase